MRRHPKKRCLLLLLYVKVLHDMYVLYSRMCDILFYVDEYSDFCIFMRGENMVLHSWFQSGLFGPARFSCVVCSVVRNMCVKQCWILLVFLTA